MLMINVILCLGLAYLFLRTKQMQSEIRELSKACCTCTTNADIKACDKDGVCDNDNDRDLDRDTCCKPEPVDTIPKVVEIEVEAPEDETMRCELRALGETCKGSTKELKKRIKEKKIVCDSK